MEKSKTIREQFMRIAMARLKKTYRFKPQRMAVAAKMYTRYVERLVNHVINL
jgi:hypothetical protein